MDIRLSNGGIIQDRKPVPPKEGYLNAEIVLCYLPHNKYTPYVTWKRNIDPGPTQGCYWGHYFETLGAAHQDFQRRD